MLALEEGSVIAGRYRLERELARGGMGAVWVAHQLQLDVDVAVKFMDPTFAASADARARFEREARAAAKLQSPHVVQVHDYGVEDGMPFIAMELLQGEDLGTRLKREETLSLKATAMIVIQVAKALRRAQEGSIVHRDLKPGNIFLARHQDEEIVKVLDFGIAKASDATKVGESTKTGTLMGSPLYMSPEQARGSKQLDHRSDLWSLGVIVFRMLTGQLPFPGDEIGEVIMAICADPIPVPSQVAPHLGPEVDRFFERALARDVTKRFQTARELAEALAAVADSMAGMGAETSWSSGASPIDASVSTTARSSPRGPGPSVEASGPRAPAPTSASTPAVDDTDGMAKTTIAPGSVREPEGGATAALTGTLAPTGNSLAVAPKRGLRTALVAAIGLGVALVAAAVFLLLRGPTPDPLAASAPETNAPSATLSSMPPPEARPAAPPPTTSASSPEPAEAASAAAVIAATPARSPGGHPPPAKKAATPAADKGTNGVLGF